MTFRLVLVLSMVVGAGCAPGQAGGGVGQSEAADALRTCASGALTKGVDVSYYEGSIDWAEVADVNEGNQAFAFIRAGDGDTHDTKFAEYWQDAADAGLYRGAYLYFRASDDPVHQAEVLLNSIDWQIGPQDLPPVLDLETKDGMSSATVASRAATFVEYIYAALGRKPLVYTGSGFEDEIGDPTTIAEYPLWVANWTSGCPSIPHNWSSWRFWQHEVAPYGTVPGIESKTDLDYFNGSAADLAAYAGPNGAD